MLRLIDPTRGVVGDSIWSRGFTIKPSTWQAETAYVAAESPSATSSSSRHTTGVELAPAAVVGLSVGCAIAGLAVGMVLVLNCGPRLEVRQQEDADEEEASATAGRAPMTMHSRSEKPSWMHSDATANSAQPTSEPFQSSPLSSPPRSSPQSEWRPPPRIAIDAQPSPIEPAGPRRLQPASAPGNVYLHYPTQATPAFTAPPSYEPKLGDPNNPAEVAAWRMMSNTIYLRMHSIINGGRSAQQRTSSVFGSTVNSTVSSALISELNKLTMAKASSPVVDSLSSANVVDNSTARCSDPSSSEASTSPSQRSEGLLDHDRDANLDG